MRRLPALLGLVAMIGGLGMSAQAAEPTKKVTATIAVPSADISKELGTGDVAGPGQRTCPGAGELDGVTYKWFDLKGEYKKFKAYGPTPLWDQALPSNPAASGHFMSYDIDVYAFDKKCNIINPTVSGAGRSFGGFEAFTAGKPASYAVITYYSGVHPNLEVTLEYSK